MQSMNDHASNSTHIIYAPQLYLKLVSDLRLAYYISKTETGSGYEAILKEGLSLMESIRNDVMIAEYQSLLAILVTKSPKKEGVNNFTVAIQALMRGICSSTSLGLDYVRLYHLYILLCETLVAMGNQATPTISTPPISKPEVRKQMSEESASRKLSTSIGGSYSTTPTTRSPRKSIQSQLSVDVGGVSGGGRRSPKRTRKTSLGGTSTPPVSENKMVLKECYQSWCASKMACAILDRYESLAHLSSELHDTEINQPIPPTQLIKLPEAVITELSPSLDITEKLMTDNEPLPLDMLLPFATPSSNKDITWFTLLGYYYTLHRNCFRSSSLPWEGPCTHCLSHLLIPHVRAVHSFLSTYCPLFNAQCDLVKVPPTLSSLVPEPPPNDVPSSFPIASSAEALPNLVSDEGEVLISWYQLMGTSPLKGFISLNHKTLRSVLSVPVSTSHMKYSGAEIYCITADLVQLQQLRCMWEELDKRCGQFVTEQVTRPLSRSPSRMKKKSIDMARKGVPQELQVN